MRSTNFIDGAIIGVAVYSVLFLADMYLSMQSEPQRANNLVQYEIHYQRCISEPGGNVEACHDVAKFKSQVCVGCD